MRHVDDAHQPEAQREPNGGENVDRRDAEAVEDLSDEESGVHMVRSEEHTSELQSLMRISYAVFCLKTKTAQGQTALTHRRKRHIKPATSPVTRATPEARPLALHRQAPYRT